MPGHTSQAPTITTSAMTQAGMISSARSRRSNRAIASGRVLYEMALFLHQPFIEMLLTFNRAN